MEVTAPPERYNFPYPGQVIERVLPLDEARKLCASIGIYADGCSAFVTGKTALTLATSFYRSMASTPLPLTADTNLGIAMVGRQTIHQNSAALAPAHSAPTSHPP